MVAYRLVSSALIVHDHQPALHLPSELAGNGQRKVTHRRPLIDHRLDATLLLPPQRFGH